jgi:hypothetical protein
LFRITGIVNGGTTPPVVPPVEPPVVPPVEPPVVPPNPVPTVVLAGGVLTVNGTASRENLGINTRRGVLQVGLAGQITNFDPADVTSIVINTLGGGGGRRWTRAWCCR